MLYNIPEDNFEALEKKINTLRKKCDKYGCELTFKVVGEEYGTVHNEDLGYRTIRYIVVDVDGIARIDGWRLVAILDHNPDVNVITTLDGWKAPEELRTAAPKCEHCGRKHSRIRTCIVENLETHEIKQVGTSCLMLYTGGISAAIVTYFMSYLKDVEEATKVNFTKSGTRYFSTWDYMIAVKLCINRSGFKGTADGDEATSVQAYDEMRRLDNPAELNKIKHTEEYAEANAAVEDLVKFFETEEISAGDTYASTLKSIFSSRYIQTRHFGYAASAFQYYNRALARKKEEEDRKNNPASYIGNVGDRLNRNVISGRCVASWDSMYGTTFLYQFMDAAGNIFMWRTDKFIEADKVKSIVGTIKEHSEYRGIKQNVLTRCKVVA